MLYPTRSISPVFQLSTYLSLSGPTYSSIHRFNYIYLYIFITLYQLGFAFAADGIPFPFEAKPKGLPSEPDDPLPEQYWHRKGYYAFNVSQKPFCFDVVLLTI